MSDQAVRKLVKKRFRSVMPVFGELTLIAPTRVEGGRVYIIV